MEQTQRRINSRIGPLYLVASEKGLQGVFWTKQRAPMVTDESERKSLILKKAELQLEEYLSGKRKDFDLPLDPRGTEFQKRVWEQLAKIPYGQTRSYKDIAKALNQENASRAVGSANGQNPLSIIVPCHRVISSNGSLGGYAGGLGIKEALLSLEKKGCPH